MDFKLDAYPVDDYTSGVQSRDKIKILICYAFKVVGIPISKDTVLSVFYDNGLVNYFEIAQALFELQRAGSIREVTVNGKTLLELTDKGLIIAEDAQNTLSSYMRNRAAQTALKTIMYERRLRQNDVQITQLENDKYAVDITMYKTDPGVGLAPSEDDVLLKLTFYASDIMQANRLRDTFYNNPNKLYENIVDALTGDYKFVDD